MTVYNGSETWRQWWPFPSMTISSPWKPNIMSNLYLCSVCGFIRRFTMDLKPDCSVVTDPFLPWLFPHLVWPNMRDLETWVLVGNLHLSSVCYDDLRGIWNLTIQWWPFPSTCDCTILTLSSVLISTDLETWLLVGNLHLSSVCYDDLQGIWNLTIQWWPFPSTSNCTILTLSSVLGTMVSTVVHCVDWL